MIINRQSLIIAVLAFGARLVPVLRGGGLYGLGGYDDGVHFAAALGLVHGRLPYRDFLLLHPPGIVVALAPFAALAGLIGDANAFAVARVAFMLLGAVTAVLIWHLLRPLGQSSAVVGAGAYAIFYPAVYAEHSTLLEGLANAAMIGAMLIVTRTLLTRRWVVPTLVAGACLGLSASTKIWGVVPATVMIIWCALTGGWRRGSTLLAGLALGATAICLPFFAAAAIRMWHYVVLDQLGRPYTSGVLTRLPTILGLNHVGSGDNPVVVGAAILLISSAAVPAWRSPIGRLSVLLLVADTGLLLTTPPFFQHYAALTAAPLVLVMGSAVGPLAQRVEGRSLRVIAVALLAVVAILAAVPTFTSSYGQALPATLLRSALAHRGGCTTSDDPTTLIETDVLSQNLRRGCALVVDLGGYNYHLQPPTRYLSRARNPAWQRHATAYLRSGTTTIVARFSHQPGFDAATKEAVHAWRVIARAPKITVRVPS